MVMLHAHVERKPEHLGIGVGHELQVVSNVVVQKGVRA